MAENSITLAEETVLRLKQLELKFENMETDMRMSDCCFNELDADQEEDRNKIDKLEKRVTQLETDLQVEHELSEERIATLKIQNVELRNHINLLVDTINNITSVLNGNMEVDSTQSNDEPADQPIEVDGDEPTQLTLRQVCDMYQSQPMDEEDWEEMTKAIKAAEEYEGSLQKQQELSTTVNGLTQDEWNDLLYLK